WSSDVCSSDLAAHLECDDTPQGPHGMKRSGTRSADRGTHGVSPPLPPFLFRTYVRTWRHGHHRPAGHDAGPRTRPVSRRTRAGRRPPAPDEAPGPALPAPRRPRHPQPLPRRLRTPRARGLRRLHRSRPHPPHVRRRAPRHRLRHRLRPPPAPPHRHRPGHQDRHRRLGGTARDRPATPVHHPRHRGRPDAQRRTPPVAERPARRRRPQLCEPARPGHRRPRRRRLPRGPRLPYRPRHLHRRPRHGPPPPGRLPTRPAADPPAATPAAPPHALAGRRARPGPGAVRPRRPRGPAEHPPVLGRLPRLRGRHRSRPRGPPRPRGPRHRPVRTRGPRDDRLGGPPHRSHPLTCPDPAPRPPENRKTPMHHRSRVPTMSLARVVLTSGREVNLSELRLSSTYGGLLEGYPCKPLNDLWIKGLLRSAAQAFPGAPVHL